VHQRCRRPIIDLRFSPWRKSSLSKQCLQQEHCQAQLIKARRWIFTLKGKILNFSCAVAPTRMPLLQRHRSRSQFLLVTKTRVTIARPQISTSMSFSASTTERKTCSMIITASRASKRSLCNQTARVKTWVRSTEFHPIRQPPGLNRLMERRRSLPEHDTSARSMKTSTGRSASWRENKSKDHRHYSQD
jgi:hypothetical protein